MVSLRMEGGGDTLAPSETQRQTGKVETALLSWRSSGQGSLTEDVCTKMCDPWTSTQGAPCLLRELPRHPPESHSQLSSTLSVCPNSPVATGSVPC